MHPVCKRVLPDNTFAKRKALPLALFAALLFVFSMVLISHPAYAADFTATSNEWDQDYTMYGTTVKSYLHVNANGALERVEYTDGQLIVETVSEDYSSATSQKTIDASTYEPSDLAEGSAVIWGGYYAGSDANYVVTGQANTNESEDLVVYRITKYTQDWEYSSHCEVKGANTYKPFEAGSCRMVESGGILYVRTCHTMFDSGDGLHHQASVALNVRESDMTLSSSMTDIMNIEQTDYGYVSHSFNQHVAALEGTVYSIDQGDAYPRAMVLKQYGSTGAGSYAELLTYSGSIGANSTFASVGGMETSATADTVLAVGNTVDQDTIQSLSYRSSVPRNVFVTVTPVSNGAIGDTKTVYLTSYTDTDMTGATTPQIVKINDDRFMVLWGAKTKASSTSSSFTYEGDVHYAIIDAQGNIVKPATVMPGALSDCNPIVKDGKVVWYAGVTQWSTSSPVFYVIDAATGEWTSERRVVNATVVLSDSSYTFDYESHRPTATVSFNGKGLVEGTDYTLSYSGDGVNAGSPCVVITGIGSYKGVLAVPYTIEPVDVYRNLFGTYDGFKVYTGSKIVPATHFSYKGHWLTEGVDYTVSVPDDAIGVGTYYFWVYGKGNFSGNVGYQLSIRAASMEAADVAPITDVVYTGEAAHPVPSVSYNGTTLVEGVDYTVSYGENVNADSGTVVLTAVEGSNFTGTKTVEFQIAPQSISGASVTGLADTVYDGAAHEPEPTVTFDGKTLAAGTDYIVSYTDNVNAGTATATVTGTGNYTGAATGTFRILPADIASASIAPIAAQTHTGDAVEPALDISFNGEGLVEGVDYTVVYRDNVDVGSATATITGRGNFTGSVTAAFRIVEAVPMHRLYNPWTGEHLYTASSDEVATLTPLGWRDEGIGWYAPKSGTAVHRLYNPWAPGGEHHYTMDMDEVASLVAAGWSDEGLSFYSTALDDEDAVPVYREYNPNAFSCNHNYTADKTEHDGLVQLGWRDEGIGWYGVDIDQP